MSGARWLPALLGLALVLTLTSIPNPNVPVVVAGGDKVAHAIMYGVLAALVAFAIDVGGRGAGRLGVTFVGIAALAAADEYHQRFIPGRSATVSDWIADSAGAATTILATAALWRRREIAR